MKATYGIYDLAGCRMRYLSRIRKRLVALRFAQRLRLLVSKVEIPAYRSIPGSFVLRPDLETGNRKLSRENGIIPYGVMRSVS